MRFSSSLAILASAAATVNAATHQVAVGEGGLKYTPNTTIAAVGDTVVFFFYPMNHNVVQGSYDTPCMTGNGSTGIYSGFIPSNSGVANRTFHITINNTDPIWYYCSQKGVGGHCTKGMAGVINPPNSTEMTLENYITAAANVANTSYSQPSEPQYGIVVANTSSSESSSSSASTSSSHASITGAPAATSTTNAGAILDATKWGVGAAAGGLVFAMF